MSEETRPSVRLRAALGPIPAYKAGRPPAEIEGLEPFKMSSNENPFPPLPSVVEAIAAQGANVNRYPGMGMEELRERIGSHVGVPADEVVVGAGSSALLTQAVAACIGQDDEVVYAWRSFELYPILVGLAGGVSVQVPLAEGGRHDLPAMARAINERTGLVIVCSPNNPTGTTLGRQELEEFMATVPRDVVVVLDEAYLEFAEDGTAEASLELYRAHENLVLMRTFSKAYGLAGLRVGYAVAHPAVAEALRKTAAPFGVTEFAQAAAIASLDAQDELDSRVAECVSERDRLATALRELGYDVPETHSNFVWLPLGERAMEFAAAAEAAALAVRPFAGEGVRASVDAPEAQDRFIRVAREFAGR